MRTLESLAPQLADGDEILVIRRDNVPKGNATRDAAIPRCMGTHLWWMDDDDIATPGALAVIREKVSLQPERIHIFKMQYNNKHGGVLWADDRLTMGNVGGTMAVVPNVPGKLGSWVTPGIHCGDYHFLKETVELQGGPPVFHEDIIATIRPDA